MTETAIVVSGDYSPLADVGPIPRPLTMTPGGRLRVDTGGGDDGGATVIAGGNATTAVSPANPLPVDVGDLGSGEYETVAASQTDQVLGATGAAGDYLSHLLIVPATAAAGAVSIKDGSGSAITVFAGGGTTALPTLAPFAVPLGARASGAGWKVTTGANVSVIGVGNFT